MKDSDISKVAHILFWLVILFIGYFHLGVPTLSILFSYLILSLLGSYCGIAWTLFIYFGLMGAVCTSFGFFAKEAIIAIPKTLDKALPILIQYAEEWDIPLPFYDVESLKSLIS